MQFGNIDGKLIYFLVGISLIILLIVILKITISSSDNNYEDQIDDSSNLSDVKLRNLENINDLSEPASDDYLDPISDDSSEPASDDYLDPISDDSSEPASDVSSDLKINSIKSYIDSSDSSSCSSDSSSCSSDSSSCSSNSSSCSSCCNATDNQCVVNRLCNTFGEVRFPCIKSPNSCVVVQGTNIATHYVECNQIKLKCFSSEITFSYCSPPSQDAIYKFIVVDSIVGNVHSGISMVISGDYQRLYSFQASYNNITKELVVFLEDLNGSVISLTGPVTVTLILTDSVDVTTPLTNDAYSLELRQTGLMSR